MALHRSIISVLFERNFKWPSCDSEHNQYSTSIENALSGEQCRLTKHSPTWPDILIQEMGHGKVQLASLRSFPAVSPRIRFLLPWHGTGASFVYVRVESSSCRPQDKQMICSVYCFAISHQFYIFDSALTTSKTWCDHRGTSWRSFAASVFSICVTAVLFLNKQTNLPSRAFLTAGWCSWG